MRLLSICAVAALLPATGLTNPLFSSRLTASPSPLIHKASERTDSLVRSAAAPVGESCGAGKDMVVQALELVKADSSQSDLTDANEHLKRAADLCSESGEAWYYRSLVEAKLGHKALADFALRKAKMFPSEAMAEGMNPFVLAAPKGAAPLGPIQDKWALVIGINTFSDPNIPSLRFTTDDATSVRDVLIDAKHGGGFKPDHVRLLRNQEATLRDVKESLNWLARNAKEDDLVVVYLASHGTARELDTTKEANYIITHDTDFGIKSRAKPDEVTNADTLYATALPMVELANDVATRFKARRTAIFIDTCNSGGASAAHSKLLAPGVANASVSERALEQMHQGEGRIIFSASQTEQESYESDSLHHGFFTYYLVQALRQNPAIPLSQVFALVKKQVVEGVNNDSDLKLSGAKQTPVMSRSSADADFALGESASTTARLASR